MEYLDLNTTVKEIERTLIQLYPTFRKLFKWLKYRDKKNQNWILLVSCLEQIVNGESELDIKSSLGSYMQKRGDKDKESKVLIKERVKFSRMLINLAEDIENIFEPKKN